MTLEYIAQALRRKTGRRGTRVSADQIAQLRQHSIQQPCHVEMPMPWVVWHPEEPPPDAPNWFRKAAFLTDAAEEYAQYADGRREIHEGKGHLR